MEDRRTGTPLAYQPPFSRLKHLFVGDVPLLYPEINVARQVQIEVFLDLKLDAGGYGSENILLQAPEVRKRLEYLV